MKKKIKISDLLIELRKELDSASKEKEDQNLEPKYKIRKIILEVFAERINSGTAGLSLNIANIGGTIDSKNYHKIIIEMSPKDNH